MPKLPESLRGRPPFLHFLPKRDLLRRHLQKTAMPKPMSPTPAMLPIAIPAICPVLRDIEESFFPCPPDTSSGTSVLVLVSVAEVLVKVNVGATGSVVRISRADVVDDVDEPDDDVCLVRLADLVVGTLVDLVSDGLRLDNDVGSVTSVGGRESDDCDCLGIAVGIVVLLVLDAGGNVIGPVPVIGTARVAVMTE